MSQLDAVLQAINELHHDLDGKIADLDGKIADLDHKMEMGLTNLTAGLEEQQQLIRALQRDSGSIVERQLQDGIRRQFGAAYSKQLLARSIVDFCHLFTDGLFGRRDNKAAGQLSFIRPATQVAHVEHDLYESVQSALPT